MKQLVGAMRSSFDEMFLYNGSPTGGGNRRWSGCRNAFNAEKFDPANINTVRRLLVTVAWARGLIGLGYSPVVYEIEMESDNVESRMSNREPTRRQVWPLTPLEQLAKCAK